MESMIIVWIDRSDNVRVFRDVVKYWNEGDGFWRLRKNNANICINELDIKVLGRLGDVLDEADRKVLLEQKVEEGTGEL